MAQLSLPYRIAVVSLLVLAALWFTVLRPQPASDSTATAPGVTGLGNAVDKAKGAVDTSKDAAARSEGAAGQPSTGTAGSSTSSGSATAQGGTGSAAAKPDNASKIAASDPSAALVRQIDKGRVVVLAFLSSKASDDRAVRSALARIDRHKGKVVVERASSASVGDYAAITQDVKVLQTPTVMVIGRDLKARTLAGYTYTSEIDQLVSDALARKAIAAG